jgi:peptide/nickel transport system substrate-binding protein
MVSPAWKILYYNQLFCQILSLRIAVVNRYVEPFFTLTGLFVRITAIHDQTREKSSYLRFLSCHMFACGRKKETAFYDNPGKPSYGDMMITASIGEASNLIPILASDSASHEIANYVYNGLVKLDKNLNIVGDLAESWELSKDNLTITFHLRKGVRWHDGTPFTAKDVMYTYKVIVDPKTPTPYSGDFKEVKDAQIIDDYTFRATYKKTFAPGLISWGTSVLPAHLLEGTDITKSPLGRKPVGTGPYKFKEWIAGDRVVLTANDDYFEGKPFVGRQMIRVIPDTATIFLN